jgi:hypothetical protein
MSALSQTRVGVGKPSFLRFTIAGGHDALSARRRANFVSIDLAGA